MARDGSGNYTNPYPDFVSGTVISSTQVDANNAAIAVALTQSIAVDGQSVVTGNIPMSNKKFTGVSSTSGQGSRTEFPAAGVVQDGDLTELVSVGGSGDVVTASAVPSIAAYAAGQRFSLVVGSTNTTNVTININGLGAKAVEKLQAPLVAGDWTSGDVVDFQYDGTQFQMLSPARTLVLTADSIPGSAVAIATSTARGSVEFATTAETETGTSAALAVTPDGLHDMTTLSGAGWFLDEDNMASDSAVKTASQQSIAAYVTAQILASNTPGYAPAEQTVTASTDLALTHGLGGIPSKVRVSLRCKTADLGFSIADEIPISAAGTVDGADGIIISYNATQVKIRTGSAIELLNGSFANANITVGSWRWVVEAFA